MKSPVKDHTWISFPSPITNYILPYVRFCEIFPRTYFATKYGQKRPGSPKPPPHYRDAWAE